MEDRKLTVTITEQDLDTAIAAVQANEAYSCEKDIQGFVIDPRYQPQTSLCVLYQAAHRADTLVKEVGILTLYRLDGEWRTKQYALADIVSDFDEYVLNNNPEVLESLRARLPATFEFEFKADNAEYDASTS